GASRIEGSGFRLRCLGRSTVHLRRGSLINPRSNLKLANRFQQTGCAEAGDIAGVLGRVEGDFHMALCAEVVDLVRVDHSQNAIQRSEEHTSELQSRVDLVCRLLLEK